MIDHSIYLTRQKLASRATSIEAPASEIALREFEERYQISVHSGLRRFYRLCNGLTSAGPLLITFDRIEEVIIAPLATTNRRYFKFADVLLGSDHLASDFSDPGSPIIMVAAEQVLATDFSALLGEILGQP